MAIPNVSAWIIISKASVLSMVSPLSFRLLGVVFVYLLCYTE